jgi:hypothetical protein
VATLLEWFELLSYVVTVVGLPLAIYVFLHEQGRERANEQEAIYQSLADQYDGFLRLILDHADLGLSGRYSANQHLTDEQRERKHLIFEVLISLFERAYIMLYDADMDRQTKRMWASWEDYMRTWCRREDLRDALPFILEGEDDGFSRYILSIARENEPHGDRNT